MRILLDESVPRPFARLLQGHEVHTVPQVGWAAVTNGELLRRAALARFDVLVTADRNLEHQQNLADVGVAIVVLVAPTNRIQELQPLAPTVLAVIDGLLPGEVVRVERRP